MNKWQSFIALLALWADGEIITRKSLIEINADHLSARQVDHYRLHLTRAGYLKATRKPGRYKLVFRPDVSFRWRDCIRAAYPKRKRSDGRKVA